MGIFVRKDLLPRWPRGGRPEMKKELLLCGVLVMFGTGAAPALGSVESDVENAVAGALSAVSAKAEKVTFSAGDQSLVISGLEYAGPQEGSQRKGRIEQIRLDGFDAKAILDAEGGTNDIPRVAENAVLSGWSEVSEEDGVKVSMTLESYAARGWYQRLGVLLKRSSQEDLGPLLEEILRYRLDSARAENLSIRLESAKKEFAPVNVTVKALEGPDGVAAPGDDGQPRMANMQMLGLAFSSGDVSGSMEKLALSGLAIPSPSQMAELWKKVSEAGVPDEPQDALKMLADLYGGKPPFSLLSLENMKVWTAPGGDPATLDNLSLSMSHGDQGASGLEFAINALRVAPSALGEFREMAMRYAPEGVALDMRVRGNAAGSGSDAAASLRLRGLGSLELGCAIKGNALDLLAQLAALDDDAAVQKLLSDVSVTSAKFSYSDTGLIPLAVNLALESGDAVGLDSLNLAMQYAAEQGLDTDFTVRGLHAGLDFAPLEQYRAEISRFAPGGITVDVSQRNALTKDGFAGNASAAVRGLGKMDLDLALKGDVLGILKKAANDPDNTEELLPLLSQVKVAGCGTGYKDSGLAAMLLGIAAKEFGMTPADLLAMAVGQVEQLATSGDPFFEKLGKMLKEQLAQPGEMSVRLARDADMDVMTFAMTAAESPDKLPLEFSSVPGGKTMEEYLK
jgi:hypothetical protein